MRYVALAESDDAERPRPEPDQPGDQFWDDRQRHSGGSLAGVPQRTGWDAHVAESPARLLLVVAAAALGFTFSLGLKSRQAKSKGEESCSRKTMSNHVRSGR
jgi:hypothetical protein